MNRHVATMLFLALAGLGAGAVTAKDAPPPPLREVVLIRHGHYLADPAIDERVGPGLSPIGIAQARLAAARLHADLPRIDALFVSPMQRARDTAASIGAAYPAQTFAVVDDLAECTPPTRRKEITAAETPELMAACKARLDRAFTRFFETPAAAGRTEVIVAHGNVIRYIVTRALGVDTQAWLEMSIGHASVTRIRIEADGRYKVIAVGDVGHMPSNLRTGAGGDVDRSLAVDVLQTHATGAEQ